MFRVDHVTATEGQLSLHVLPGGHPILTLTTASAAAGVPLIPSSAAATLGTTASPWEDVFVGGGGVRLAEGWGRVLYHAAEGSSIRLSSTPAAPHLSLAAAEQATVEGADVAVRSSTGGVLVEAAGQGAATVRSAGGDVAVQSNLGAVTVSGASVAIASDAAVDVSAPAGLRVLGEAGTVEVASIVGPLGAATSAPQGISSLPLVPAGPSHAVAKNYVDLKFNDAIAYSINVTDTIAEIRVQPGAGLTAEDDGRLGESHSVVLNMGTPSTLSADTTNIASAASHTHSVHTVAPSSAASGILRTAGAVRTPGEFYASASSPVSTTPLKYDGFLHAARLHEGNTRIADLYVPRTVSFASPDGTIAVSSTLASPSQTPAVHLSIAPNSIREDALRDLCVTAGKIFPASLQMSHLSAALVSQLIPAPLAEGHVRVGGASGGGDQLVTLSGDVRMDFTGAVTIEDRRVLGRHLADGSVTDEKIRADTRIQLGKLQRLPLTDRVLVSTSVGTIAASPVASWMMSCLDFERRDGCLAFTSGEGQAAVFDNDTGLRWDAAAGRLAVGLDAGVAPVATVHVAGDVALSRVVDSFGAEIYVRMDALEALVVPLINTYAPHATTTPSEPPSPTPPPPDTTEDPPPPATTTAVGVEIVTPPASGLASSWTEAEGVRTYSLAVSGVTDAMVAAGAALSWEKMSALTADRVLVSANGMVTASSTPASKLALLDAFVPTPSKLVFSSASGALESAAGVGWTQASATLQVDGQLSVTGAARLNGIPAADTHVAARHASVTGGGVVSWDGESYHLRWSEPLHMFTLSKPTQPATSGWRTVSFPAIGAWVERFGVVQSVVQVSSAGIPVAPWDSLWFYDGDGPDADPSLTTGLYIVSRDISTTTLARGWTPLAFHHGTATSRHLKWLPAGVVFPCVPGSHTYSTLSSQASWVSSSSSSGTTDPSSPALQPPPITGILEYSGSGVDGQVLFASSTAGQAAYSSKMRMLLEASPILAAAGGDFTVFLLSDGRMVGVGGNAFGQAGAGSSAAFLSEIAPSALEERSAFVDAGHRHAAAVGEDGSLFTFGENAFGETGHDPATHPAVRAPRLVPFLERVTRVACGESHTVALTVHGALLSCGSNSAGQLGRSLLPGVVATHAFDAAPLPAGAVAVQVACGRNHTVALLADGTLAAFGANARGQLALGAGDVTNRFAATAVPGVAGVAAVACGGDTTAIVLSTGEALAAGWNGRGQLGVDPGITPQSSVPISLPSSSSSWTGASVGADHVALLSAAGDVHLLGVTDVLGAPAWTLSEVYRAVDHDGDVAARLASGDHHLLVSTAARSVLVLGMAEAVGGDNTQHHAAPHDMTPEVVQERSELNVDGAIFQAGREMATADAVAAHASLCGGGVVSVLRSAEPSLSARTTRLAWSAPVSVALAPSSSTSNDRAAFAIPAPVSGTAVQYYAAGGGADDPFVVEYASAQGVLMRPGETLWAVVDVPLASSPALAVVHPSNVAWRGRQPASRVRVLLATFAPCEDGSRPAEEHDTLRWLPAGVSFPSTLAPSPSADAHVFDSVAGSSSWERPRLGYAEERGKVVVVDDDGAVAASSVASSALASLESLHATLTSPAAEGKMLTPDGVGGVAASADARLTAGGDLMLAGVVMEEGGRRLEDARTRQIADGVVGGGVVSVVRAPSSSSAVLRWSEPLRASHVRLESGGALTIPFPAEGAVIAREGAAGVQVTAQGLELQEGDALWYDASASALVLAPAASASAAAPRPPEWLLLASLSGASATFLANGGATFPASEGAHSWDLASGRTSWAVASFGDEVLHGTLRITGPVSASVEDQAATVGYVHAHVASTLGDVELWDYGQSAGVGYFSSPYIVLAGRAPTVEVLSSGANLWVGSANVDALRVTTLAPQEILVSGAAGEVLASNIPAARLGWINSAAFSSEGALVFSRGAGQAWHSSSALRWLEVSGELEVQGSVRVNGTLRVGGGTRGVATNAGVHAGAALVGGGHVTWTLPEGTVRWDAPVFSPLQSLYVPPTPAEAFPYRRVTAAGVVEELTSASSPPAVPLGVAESLWHDAQGLLVVALEAFEPPDGAVFLGARGVDAFKWAAGSIQFPGAEDGEHVYDTSTAKASWLALNVAQGGRVVVSDQLQVGQVVSSEVASTRLAYIDIAPEDAPADGVMLSRGPNAPLRAGADLTYDTPAQALRVRGEVRVRNAAGDRESRWAAREDAAVLSVAGEDLLSVPWNTPSRLGLNVTTPAAALHVHSPSALACVVSSAATSTRLAVHAPDSYLEIGADANLTVALAGERRLDVTPRHLALTAGELPPGDFDPPEVALLVRAAPDAPFSATAAVGVRGWQEVDGEGGTFFVRHGVHENALTIGPAGGVGVGVATSASSLAVAGGVAVGNALYAASKQVDAGELAVQARLFVTSSLSSPSGLAPDLSIYADGVVQAGGDVRTAGAVHAEGALTSALLASSRVLVSSAAFPSSVDSSALPASRLSLLANAHTHAGALLFAAGGDGEEPLLSSQALVWDGSQLRCAGAVVETLSARESVGGGVTGGGVVRVRRASASSFLLRWTSPVYVGAGGRRGVAQAVFGKTAVSSVSWPEGGAEALTAPAPLASEAEAVWLVLGEGDSVWCVTDGGEAPEELEGVRVVRGAHLPAAWEPGAGWTLLATVSPGGVVKWVPSATHFPELGEEAGSEWSADLANGQTSWAFRSLVSGVDRVLVSDVEGNLATSDLASSRLSIIDVDASAFSADGLVLCAGADAPLLTSPAVGVERLTSGGPVQRFVVGEGADVVARGGGKVVLDRGAEGGVGAMDLSPTALVLSAPAGRGLAFVAGGGAAVLTVSSAGAVQASGVVLTSLSADEGRLLVAGAGGAVAPSSVPVSLLARLDFPNVAHRFVMSAGGDALTTSDGLLEWDPAAGEMSVGAAVTAVNTLRASALDISAFEEEAERAEGKVMYAAAGGRVVTSPYSASRLSAIDRDYAEAGRGGILFHSSADRIEEVPGMRYDDFLSYVRMADLSLTVEHGFISITNSPSLPPITAITYSGVSKSAALMLNDDQGDMLAMRTVTGGAIALGVMRMERWEAEGAEARSRLDVCLGRGDLNAPDTLREVLSVRCDRRVGVNTTSPEWALHVVGDVHATGAVTEMSDARIKSDVRTIDDALGKVLRLGGYTFTLPGGERSAGVIAQEVREVLPEVVREDSGGMLSVAYGNLVGLLIEAVKQLSARVEHMEDGRA